MPVSWTDREPGYFALRSEVARLGARARRRKGLVLLGALLAAAAAVVFTLRAPRLYHAQISVRVTEVVEFHLPRSSWTDRELRSYVTDVAFTNQVLLDVYDRFLRATEKRKTEPARAIMRLRDALDVKVVRNRIVVAMEGKTGPRSAHVVLRFAAPTAEQATGVLKALVRPIMETSARRRRHEAAMETRRATLALEESRKTLAELNRQAYEQAAAPFRGTDISPSRLTALADALADTRRQVDAFAAEKDAAERRERSEKARPGINFEIADENVVAPLPLAPLLLTVGLVVFILSLPLASLVVGAFDPYVSSVEDVRRLGLPALGRLRHVHLAERTGAPGRGPTGRHARARSASARRSRQESGEQGRQQDRQQDREQDDQETSGASSGDSPVPGEGRDRPGDGDRPGRPGETRSSV